MTIEQRQIETAIAFLLECRESYQNLKSDHVLSNMKAMQILGIETTLIALGIDFPREELS